MAVPYIFAASTSAIPLANLDANFAYFANAISVSGTVATFGSDLFVNGNRAGKGANSLSQNTAFGSSALSNGSLSGNYNEAFGFSALGSCTSGAENSAYGRIALAQNTTGSNNSAFGTNSLYGNTTGSSNTGYGHFSLTSNVAGTANTAVGESAMGSTTGGTSNTAVGSNAMQTGATKNRCNAFGVLSLYNCTGNDNTAVGYYSLGSGVITGSNNTAVGNYSMQSTTSGSNSTAVGNSALQSMTTGSSNIAVGGAALAGTTSGVANCAIGLQAMVLNQTGNSNVAIGSSAGFNLLSSNNNVLIGHNSGAATTGNGNVFVGAQSGQNVTTGYANCFVGSAWNTNGAGYDMTTGIKNTILGSFTGNQGGLDIRTLNNYIVLSDGDGNPRIISDSIGDIIIGGTTSSATARLNVYQSDSSQRVVHFENTRNVSSDENVRVKLGSNCLNTSSYQFICTTGTNDVLYIYGNGNVVNSNNSYGALSDAKLKENIVDATPKLEKINQLKVRNFNFKNSDMKQIGFVAQEFEIVFPSLVDETDDRDKDGNDLGTKTKSIKTSVLVPILVKAIQELTEEINQLKQKVGA
jgi:hypothetical protein